VSWKLTKSLRPANQQLKVFVYGKFSVLATPRSAIPAVTELMFKCDLAALLPLAEMSFIAGVLYNDATTMDSRLAIQSTLDVCVPLGDRTICTSPATPVVVDK